MGLPLALGLAAALSLAALALRLFGLGDKPLWYDEIITLARVKLPLAELIADSLGNSHFPTYFLIAAPFAPPDMNAWMLRLPSAVFGAGSVLLLTLLAAGVRGWRAGLVAGALMALSPFEVQFGQEARAYSLISCMVLLALWGLVRLAQRPAAAALPLRQGGAPRAAWAGYTLGTAGALLVQNIAVPWLIASNLALALIARRMPAGRSGLLRNWAWSQAAILLLWLPSLVVMLTANKGGVLNAVGWVPGTTWNSFWSTVSAVYLFRVSDLMTLAPLPTLVPGFGIAVLLLAAFGVWRLRSERGPLLALGLGLLAMPIALLLTSLLHAVLIPRYLIYSTGPFFALAGIGTAALPRRAFPLVASCLVAGGALSLAPYYSSDTKPRWDRAADYLARHVRGTDAIVVQDPLVRFVLSAYGRQFDVDPRVPILIRNPRDPSQRAAGRERIWVVYGRVGQGAVESEQEFRQRWSAFGTPAADIRFGSNVLLLRFDRPSLARQREFGIAPEL